MANSRTPLPPFSVLLLSLDGFRSGSSSVSELYLTDYVSLGEPRRLSDEGGAGPILVGI